MKKRLFGKIIELCEITGENSDLSLQSIDYKDVDAKNKCQDSKKYNIRECMT